MCDRLVVMNNGVEEFKIPLSNYFSAITDYSTYRYKLEKASQYKITYNNITQEGGCKFIFIMADFDIESDYIHRILEWGYDAVSISWIKMGGMLLLTTNGEADYIDEIWIKNPSDDYDVNITVLFGL